MRAGVFLDGIAGGIVENTEALDEEDLVLARADGVQTEQIEAAIRDARLHRAADHVGDEKIGGEAQTFGRGHPVLFLRFHFLAEAAGGGPQAVERKVGGKRSIEYGLDVFDRRGSSTTREKASTETAWRSPTRSTLEHAILEPGGGRPRRPSRASLSRQIGFEGLEHLGILGRGEIVIVRAELHPAAIGSGIEQNDADRTRSLAGQNGIQKHVSTAAVARDGNDAGRHGGHVLFYLSDERLGG